MAGLACTSRSHARAEPGSKNPCIKFSLRQIKTYVAREWVQIITTQNQLNVATPSNFNTFF